MAEELKGKLTHKNPVSNPDGATRKTWKNDKGETYYFAYLKFDVDGKEYAGEYMTSKADGPNFEIGKEYTFEFIPNDQYGNKIKKVQDPANPNRGFGNRGGYGGSNPKVDAAAKALEIAQKINQGAGIDVIIPIADKAYDYIAGKAGLNAATTENGRPADLPKLEGDALKGMLEYVGKSKEQKTLNEGKVFLGKVLYKLLGYDVPQGSIYQIAEALLVGYYNVPVQNPVVTDPAKDFNVAGSMGASIPDPGAPIGNNGSDDLPF